MKWKFVSDVGLSRSNQTLNLLPGQLKTFRFSPRKQQPKLQISVVVPQDGKDAGDKLEWGMEVRIHFCHSRLQIFALWYNEMIRMFTTRVGPICQQSKCTWNTYSERRQRVIKRFHLSGVGKASRLWKLGAHLLCFPCLPLLQRKACWKMHPVRGQCGS